MSYLRIYPKRIIATLDVDGAFKGVFSLHLEQYGLQANDKKCDVKSYDIRSYTHDGAMKFIEVKSSKGSASSPFFISPNEIEFSRKNPKNYCLYRLFDLDVSSKSAKVYVIKGDLTGQLALKPTQFIAEISSHD